MSLQPFSRTLPLAALAIALAAAPAAGGPDPTRVMGAERCGECHKNEFAAWKQTTHYATLTTLHRRPSAQEIASKLGVKSLKREGVCVTCHYTEMPGASGAPEVVSGISCESCHGAARDWIDVHGDYGGKSVTRDQESPQHRTERLARSAAAGMLGPSDVGRLAARCYECHTVPNEKLVNVGGHTAGSDFELVSWSQGEVRHNFGVGEENREASPEHLRVLYVLGQALALEANLRGVAKGTEKARYATSMAKRVAAAKESLAAILAAAKIPEVEAMLSAAGGVALKLDNQAALTAAADRVGDAARRFAGREDGAGLAALDALVQAAPPPKGKVFE
jgi:hypothetical protein